MPRQRSSGSNQSDENKSDIDENGHQVEITQTTDERRNNQKQNQNFNNQQLQSNRSKQDKKQIDVQKQQQAPQRPNRYVFFSFIPKLQTLYRQSLNINWNMQNFDINKAVQQFSTLDTYPELQDSDDESNRNINQIEKQQKKNQKEIKLKVSTSNQQKSVFSKKTVYMIKGRDKNGEFQIGRTFRDFALLKEKLSLRWPGCFIAPMPTKTIGSNAVQLVAIRQRFINNFLNKISNVPQLYYSLQCQIFFNHSSQQYINPKQKLIEGQLQKLKYHTNIQLLQKYKQAYANSIQDLNLKEQQQSIAINQIKQLEGELKSWKIDLTRFKDEIRSLINVKDKYYEAMTKLSTILLPQYEDIVLGWINGDEFTQKEQGKEQSINITQKQGYLLNTQQYGTALKDTAHSVRNYNQSLWLIYDIFKFQLKETESILQAIQSYQFLVRQKDYLTRNIDINKDQVGSLQQRKTTFKIFLMSGSVQQKRQRLNKQSQGFEQKLQIVKQLLNYVLNVLINSIDNFHTDRADQYRRLLAKSSQEELVLIKKLMDFHMFELEIFKKKNIYNRIKESKIQSKKQEQIADQ